MTMSFASSFPQILLDGKLVSDIDPGQEEVIIFHNITTFVIYDCLIVDHFHFFFLGVQTLRSDLAGKGKYYLL